MLCFVLMNTVIPNRLCVWILLNTQFRSVETLTLGASLPFRLPVPLDWGGKQSVDFVRWWENESDPQLNSNVYQVAQELIQKHFPGPCVLSAFPDEQLFVALSSCFAS